MRADYNIISRTFTFTELVALVQLRSGECVRIPLKVRGILSDREALKTASDLLDSEYQKVSFIIDKKFFRSTFKMDIEKFFINSEELDREEIYLNAKERK